MKDPRLNAQYAGRQNPCIILVYSQPGRCYMVRLKPKDRHPSYEGLTAIFNIRYDT